MTTDRVAPDHAVLVEDVVKRFRLYHELNRSVKIALMRRGRAKYEEFEALKGVSFEVPAGSTFGLVGGNGSGKSTLLKCMARILRPDSGRIVTVGKVAALLELGSGFHHELSGRDNIYLNGSILGLSKREIDRRFDEIVEFSGIEHFIDTPVKNYSSGMYVRLGFSVAINIDPDVLLVDEVLAVGDEAFQRKSAARFHDLRGSGKTIVIVSHAMGSVRELCDYAAWLDYGVLRRLGTADEVVDEYVGAQAPRHYAVVSPVVVTDLDLMDGGGEVTDSVRSGSPVTVRFQIATLTEATSADVRVDVATVDGLVVASVRHAVPVTSEPRGWSVRLDALPLLPRDYKVTVAAVTPGEKGPLESQAATRRISVTAAPETVPGSRGFVPLRGVWRQD